jgi:anti-sigma B factor antagonist
MEITSVQHNDITIASVVGDLDAATSAEATAFLAAAIDAGHAKLVIEMAGVTYLSSAGLRVILGATRQARSSGGDLCLAGAASDIRRVLDMSGFSKLIKTFATAADAVASFGSGG